MSDKYFVVMYASFFLFYHKSIRTGHKCHTLVTPTGQNGVNAVKTQTKRALKHLYKPIASILLKMHS